METNVFNKHKVRVMEHKYLAYEKVSSFLMPDEENIAIITLNRPDTMNALSKGLLEEFDKTLEEIRKDDKIRCVIIMGSGRAFSAGNDLSEPVTTEAEMRGRMELGQNVFDKIETFDKPTIAAINGYALGGGLELAAACDLRIAADNAQLGNPEVNIGLIPSWGGLVRIPKLIGRAKAVQIILTGERIDAKEAERIGLVNKVVKADELKSTAIYTAGTLATRAPIAVRLAKNILAKAMEINMTEGNRLMTEGGVTCSKSEDIAEGIAAFFEKRTPKYKNK